MSAIDITWVGGEHRFALNIGLLRALQQRCDAGPEWILNRLRTGAWMVDDIIQTIGLGLEGGGMEKSAARLLVAQHVEEKPITLSVITAQMILMAALYGTGEEQADDPVGEGPGGAETPNDPSPAENGDSHDSTETVPQSDSPLNP